VSGATPHIADCTILSGLIGVETPRECSLLIMQLSKPSESWKHSRSSPIVRGMSDCGVSIVLWYLVKYQLGAHYGMARNHSVPRHLVVYSPFQLS
jgi:hypothetical protein